MRMGVATRAAITAGALALLLATPAYAGDEGDVTFRLTIRGTPVATDVFSLTFRTGSGAVSIDPDFFCGPSESGFGPPFEECEAGTYEVQTNFPVGTELTYFFLRDERQPGDGMGDEIIHQGTITVTASPQLVTLVYDYSLGTQPLPDTALRAARTQATAHHAVAAGVRSVSGAQFQ
jgi:hypothetical protein